MQREIAVHVQMILTYLIPLESCRIIDIVSADLFIVIFLAETSKLAHTSEYKVFFNFSIIVFIEKCLK